MTYTVGREILPMARHFRGTGHILRFIEFMDVGSTNQWESGDVVPAQEIIDTIHANSPSKRWKQTTTAKSPLVGVTGTGRGRLA